LRVRFRYASHIFPPIPMKRLSLLVCAVACLLGCKERNVVPTSVDARTVPLEQADSTVRVRLIRNGVRQRDFTGALMRSDEFPESAAVQGINRCVLTLLPRWKEAELRVPEI